MTPKEKAKELFRKLNMAHCNMVSHPDIIKCALICVDELLKVTHIPIMKKYWQQVKQEIEKL